MESYLNTDTTSFRAVVGEGEKALYEWESCLTDRSLTRYMNETREKTLLDAFQTDARFRDVAVMSLIDPTLTHATLMDAYHGIGIGGGIVGDTNGREHVMDAYHGTGMDRLTGRVFDPLYMPDKPILNGIDADLKRLADDAPDRSRTAPIWSMRAFAAWLVGDTNGALSRCTTALFLSHGGDPLALIVKSLLQMGMLPGGKATTPVTVEV